MDFITRNSKSCQILLYNYYEEQEKTMETGPKILVGIGILLIIVGISWQWLPLGKLPGDIIIKRENSTFYFPITTCLILSALLSVIAAFIKK
mgnify:CR=1 FL=1